MFLLIVNLFTLPVLPKCLVLGLAENAPGARMLSSVLKLRRRLLVDMLLLRVRPKVLPDPALSKLPPKVPGVLDVLAALLGVPYVLYENPKPRCFCGVVKREAEAEFSLYIGRAAFFLDLTELDKGVANGPGLLTWFVPSPAKNEPPRAVGSLMLAVRD